MDVQQALILDDLITSPFTPPFIFKHFRSAGEVTGLRPYDIIYLEDARRQFLIGPSLEVYDFGNFNDTSMILDAQDDLREQIKLSIIPPVDVSIDVSPYL